jgi:hypothetical protein
MILHFSRDPIEDSSRIDFASQTDRAEGPVEPEVARQQMLEEAAEPGPVSPSDSGVVTKAPPAKQSKPDAKIRRFHGRVALSPLRAATEAGQVSDEVISHLPGLQTST